MRICSNLSVKDITKTLEKAAMEDHTNSDMFAGETVQIICRLQSEMFAVVVLSHGNEGILYGYDHSYPAHKVGLTLANERAGHWSRDAIVTNGRCGNPSPLTSAPAWRASPSCSSSRRARAARWTRGRR